MSFWVFLVNKFYYSPALKNDFTKLLFSTEYNFRQTYYYSNKGIIGSIGVWLSIFQPLLTYTADTSLYRDKLFLERMK